MPRRVQDIVPNTHRSIRDIPVERSSAIVAPIQPPAKARSSRSIVLNKPEKEAGNKKARDIDEAPVSPKGRRSMIPSQQPRKSSRKWLVVLASVVFLVAVAGYLASVYFSYATFVITAKTIPLAINSTYISKNTPENGVLTYELAVVRGNEQIAVSASDGPKVSTSAKGKITVYNSATPQPQLLIAGTRFADQSGRIYRLTSSISVPGYTKPGASIIPGSIVASVVANQPGQSYNITRTDSVSDFKIVAYKGTPKYETVYGRISTDITGGFVGTEKKVDPKVLATATAELKSKITSSLIEEIVGTIPEGYIMYKDAYVTDFSNPIIGGDDPKTATISMNGTVYGILFKRDALVKRIAGEQALETFDGLPYEARGLESLEFSIANAQEFSPGKKNTLIIKLKGEALLAGSIPEDELKQKFAGLALSETGDILREYKPVIEIEQSSGSVTPPWARIPSDPTRVTIEILPESIQTTE